MGGDVLAGGSAGAFREIGGEEATCNWAFTMTTTNLPGDFRASVEHLLPNAARGSDEPRRVLLSVPGVRVQRLSLPAGGRLPEHATPRRALVQVLDGSCDFKAGEASWSLTTGDWVHLPPGLPHAVSAREAVVLLVTQIGAEA